MVTKLYLIRHAEAAGNEKAFFQGTTNTSITEKGMQQLTHLAERFRTIPLDALYSSPLHRAVQTAEAINRFHNLPLQIEPDLHEINGGDMEGKTWDILYAQYPAAFADWTSNLPAFHAPNGEAMTDVYARMQAVLTRIAKAHLGQTVGIVSHGLALRNFLAYVEFNSISHLADVGWADNTAVSLVEYKPASGWTLRFKQDSSHLPDACKSKRVAPWLAYLPKENPS